MIHVKPIKDLEGIPNGIAEFETTLVECEAAGGETSSDRTRKSDLLAILPSQLQPDLLWDPTNPRESYQEFRDTILTQSARITDFNRRAGRGGVHAVGEAAQDLGANAVEDAAMHEHLRASGDDENNPIPSLEELLAMVNRQRAGG